VRHLWLALREGLVEHRRALLTLAGIVVAVGLCFQIVFFFVSSDSQFCGSCHLMDPYVAEWQRSPHKDVACVQCHTEYRYALSRVYVKYALGIYTTQPRAEVPDGRCLKCHEHQNLDTDETFLKNIHFSHKNHLGEMRRGKRLHCTSCHSGQTMVEPESEEVSHVSLQEQVCFICHFKGAEKGQAVTGCLVCHGPPTTVVTHQGFQFDHGTYLKRGVRCQTCHVEVTRGDANVPRERCWTCHVGRLEAYKDSALVHQIHLTKHEIDCRRCHNTLQHGKIAMAPALGERCDSCHTPTHTPQEEMYIGIGGEGVPDTPDTMFLARVACNSCHVEAGGDPAAEAKALRGSCVQCHGQGYGRMVDDWLRGLGGLTRGVAATVSSAEARLRAVGGKREELGRAVHEARHDVDFVRQAGGQHNVHYAVELLRRAHEDAASVLKATGAAAPPTPELLASQAGYCRVCHSTSHLGTAIAFQGLTYNHNRHIAAGLTCDTCHSLDEHGKTSVTKQQCMSCHHGPEQKRPCATCHASQAAFYTKGELGDTGIKGDPDFMAQAEVACTDCHDLTSKEPLVKAVQEACVTCHDKDHGEMLVEWINDDQARGQDLAVLISRAKTALAGEHGALAVAHREDLQRAERIQQALIEVKGVHNTMLASDAGDAAKKLLSWVK
jgi:cytochrome c nitrite reductase small subunit